MIYEETYQYLLHNVSSTEFDVLLYCILNSDWDGVIQSPVYQISEQVGTTEKYLKQIIKKFTSSRRRNIFIPVNSDEGIKYAINLGPTRNLGFRSKMDRYCKKYSFFYDESFRNLSINAKRLILMSAFRMSTLKNETVMFEYNEIVPNTYNEGNRFFTRSRLMEAIEEIQNSNLKNVVTISFASNIFTHKEMILFTFAEGTLNNFVSNFTERKLLRKNMFKAGFQDFLSDAFCIEIEKVGKYLYNTLLRIEDENAKKQGVICDAKDEILKLCRFIYNSSIKDFAKSLYSNKQLLTEPKQASAYFSTIVFKKAMEEMAKYAHQAHSIKTLLDDDYLHHSIRSKEIKQRADFIDVYNQLDPIRNKFQLVKRIYDSLSNLCEEWVISRTKSVVEDAQMITSSSKEESESVKQKRGWKDLTAAKEYISNLKENVYEQINELIQQISLIGNKAIKRDTRINALKKHKESFSSFFAIQMDKVNFLNDILA